MAKPQAFVRTHWKNSLKRNMIWGSLGLLIGWGLILLIGSLFETSQAKAEGDSFDFFLYQPIIFNPFPTLTSTLTPLPTFTSTPSPLPPTATQTGLPPSATPFPTTPPNCHPSYPTVCIPPPPPDLDCSDIPYRFFTVLPPDPHHFDGDGDGIGCES